MTSTSKLVSEWFFFDFCSNFEESRTILGRPRLPSHFASRVDQTPFSGLWWVSKLSLETLSSIKTLPKPRRTDFETILGPKMVPESKKITQKAMSVFDLVF